MKGSCINDIVDVPDCSLLRNVFSKQDYDGGQRAKQMDKVLISSLEHDLRKIIRSLDDPEMTDNATLKQNLRSVANVVLLILPELEEKMDVS
jgi:hypothetical protein